MLSGFLLGIVHDRRLLREAQVNLAIRWFTGYGLHEGLPDHSSLTRIRQRWGAERFRTIFERTVQACVAAKIAKGEIVHVDASLIRADVSWESLAVRHVDAVAEANDEGVTAERDSRKTGKHKKVCITDPDATMATNGRNRRLEPSYKQHAVVDDAFGVVLDVEVTTGELNEGQVVLERIDAVAATTGAPVRTVTADAGYAYAKVYGGLERREIAAVIPAKAEPFRSPVPLRRFRYDARHDILKCPRGKILRPTRPVKHGRFFYSRAVDCKGCDLVALCLCTATCEGPVKATSRFTRCRLRLRTPLAQGAPEERDGPARRGGAHGDQSVVGSRFDAERDRPASGCDGRCGALPLQADGGRSARWAGAAATEGGDLRSCNRTLARAASWRRCQSGGAARLAAAGAWL
jgi:IS5 family transposase